MLDRYKKPGGFVQLLTLLETTPEPKREKFLALIKEEDAYWAEAVKKRLLNLRRILSWNPETLAEIVGNLQDLTLAIALHGLSEADRQLIYSHFSHGKRR